MIAACKICRNETSDARRVLDSDTAAAAEAPSDLAFTFVFEFPLRAHDQSADFYFAFASRAREKTLDGAAIGRVGNLIVHLRENR